MLLVIAATMRLMRQAVVVADQFAMKFLSCFNRFTPLPSIFAKSGFDPEITLDQILPGVSFGIHFMMDAETLIDTYPITLAEGASFLSQRGQRVYSRGPPRRYQASQQCDDQQQQRNGGKRNRVRGVHSKEQALHQPCQSQRRYKPQNKTDGNQLQSLSENEIHNVVGLRAKRQAKAELILALRDAVSHHAVNSRR